MATKTGTHTIADLVANQFASTTVVEFGVDRLAEAILADLEAHNQRMRELIEQLAMRTTERSTIYGTNDGMEMLQADEFSRGPTQKITVGGKVEFPLDKYQVALGWTYDYFKRRSVQDVARQQVGVRRAHLGRVINTIRDAFFGATNYSYIDRFKDSNTLAVKRLVNADSAAIPNGPNGESFDGSTHTHYLAAAALSSAGADGANLHALVDDVVEHGHGGKVVLYINRANETAVRALDDFVAYLDPRIVPSTAADRARPTLDITRLDNRAIGLFGAAEVWVKPWVPANYYLCFDIADPRKPLAFRESPVAGEQGLQLAGPRRLEAHPLMADYYESFFGVGAWTRTNGAVLFIDASETYTAPTF